MKNKMQFAIKITEATTSDYSIVQNMARFYVYDVSRQCGFISQDWAIPANRLYQCSDLKNYFEDNTRLAYLIEVDDELAGFALLNQASSCPHSDWNMGEFFILAKFQGKGIGAYVAQTLWDRHPGIWEVSIIPENGSALFFWQKTITNYVQNHYQCETKLIRPGQAQPHRIVFTFNTLSKVSSHNLMPPIQVTGLNHITLAVTDINTSFSFYRDVLGFQPLVKWNKGAYFLIGEFWFCLNVDQNHEPQTCYTHYAFTVSAAQFPLLAKQLRDADVSIFKENASEGESLYFLDPDGHKLEIHVGNWQARIKAKRSDLGSWQEVEWFIPDEMKMDQNKKQNASS